MTKIAIIGGGNMGHSLVHGLIQRDFAPENIWVSDPNKQQLQALKQFSIHLGEDNIAAIAHADVVIFAIKPQIFKEVVQPLSEIVAEKKPLLISIAAGIRTTHIEHWLNKDIALIRAMPNTPALIGEGATALYPNKNVNEPARQLAEKILSAIGLVVWLNDETLMDAVTALSGSGPAYFFLVIEALQKAGEALGLSPDVSRLLTLQTAIGAAKMAKESHDDIQLLRKKVTSPGGTTEKAIAVFEKNRIDAIFLEALRAAKLRSEELANLFGD